MLPILHNTRLAACLNDDWSRCVSELVTSTGCTDVSARLQQNDIFLQNALDFFVDCCWLTADYSFYCCALPCTLKSWSLS